MKFLLVVWLASDGDLDGLVEVGEDLLPLPGVYVWGLDAVSVAGQAAIAMGCDDGLIRLQLRENVCSP